MRHPKTTEMQRIEIIAWHRYKTSLGSKRTKAAELGISESAVSHVISSYVKRERKQAERQRKVAMAVYKMEQERARLVSERR